MSIDWDKHQREELLFWKGFYNRRLAILSHTDFFEMIYRCFCKSIHHKSFKRTLEIGTGGSGGFLAVIQRMKDLYSLDTLNDTLRKAHFLPYTAHINYVQGFAEKMPFRDDFFSLVIMANTLDHVQDMKQVVSEVKRVLHPKGILLFQTYLNVKNPHPFTFHNQEEIYKMIDMPVIEEHLVTDNPKWRNRNDYYVGIFRNKK